MDTLSNFCITPTRYPAFQIRLTTIANQMFLRYTPTALDDLGFKVGRASFDLDLLALLEFTYERRDFCGHLEGVPGQDPSADELATEWTSTIHFLESLVANTDDGATVESTSIGHGIDDCVPPMVAEKKYKVVRCPACDKTYGPSSVTEEDFGYEDRVVGGQRYVCPEGHFLFVFLRFDTRN